MPFLAAAALSVSIQSSDSDPNRLSIGRAGTVQVQPGQIYDLRSSRVASVDDLAEAAQGKKFVFLGEQHATKAHQLEEASVVRALGDHGRDVSVGMEMYTRPKQDVLDLWSAGTLTEEQFIDQSDWKHQWGFDYSFYKPVFDIVKERRLPLVGLNVPRDWVHAVATKGYAGLPTSAKLQLPPVLFLGNKDHRSVFDSLMGGHSMVGTGMENMYAAQVLWDEGMADTAIKYTERAPADPKAIFVVIAGGGHVMYGQGINYRIKHRKAGDGITMVMLQSDTPVEVSRGLADFVYVSPKS
ncbi:MAG TPA: ChaN family lipoprotein [Fimbriimonas sp.]|nr:ChaN family lipoprotein [Fimbriimonas sp.]